MDRESERGRGRERGREGKGECVGKDCQDDSVVAESVGQ